MPNRLFVSLMVVGLAVPVPAGAISPGPIATPTVALPTVATSASASAAHVRVTATPTRIGPSPSPTPRTTTEDKTVQAPPEDSTGEAPAGAAVPAGPVVQPRAFRTPERDAPAAFVAPQGGGVDVDGGSGAVGDTPVMGGGTRPPSRATSGLVVFRVTARTVVEGFDLRIAYPTTVGSFGTTARPAECNAGTGLIVVANDRGTGEMRLLVASGQALPFPLDVFCRFTLQPGAGIAANDFGVRVAEVTSDGKRADVGLVLVDVVVR
jgi:hypothetical protein